jgi:hypothetical protein
MDRAEHVTHSTEAEATALQFFPLFAADSGLAQDPPQQSLVYISAVRVRNDHLHAIRSAHVFMIAAREGSVKAKLT